MSRILRHVGNKDFRRTRQRQIGEQKERAAQKLKEWKEAEAERKQVEEIARPFKSDWREETQLQESDWTPVAGSIANSSAQTFQYTGLGPDGPTDTFSGLGGVEAMPSSVSVTQFGDTFDVDAPNYSQLGLQGYAKPLGMDVRRRRDYEDVNPRLDASQEFALAVGADYMMNARVDDGTLIAQVIDGEKLLPQELQDILNRRRGKSPALAGTITKDEKRKIATFMATKDGQDLLIKDPDTYGRLERAFMDKTPPRNLYPGKTPQPQDQFDDFGKSPHVRGGGMINPTAATSALASAISKLGDPIAKDQGVKDAKDVFDYYMKWAENPNSNPVNLTNKISPKGQAYLQKLAGDPSVQGLTGTRKAAALNSLYQQDLENDKIPLGLRNILGMPDVDKGDGFNVDKNGKVTFSKAYDFTNYKDTGGTDIRTGLPAMGYAISQGIGKHLGIPFIAGRESPTMNINVNVAAPSANANSLGQRGPDGGMTDAQIKVAQDKVNADRKAGKMSDIRGSKANRPYTFDKETGEPKYTGMNDQQYSDAYNKIADKYNKLRAPLEREYQRPSGQLASKSLMDKINALNDAQTAEEEALRAKREAQENEFNDLLQDYYDRQDAANKARQDVLDEIDNEEDPYSDLLGRLGAELEKLRREGKLIKREEIIGPGEEGYVDTTNMANAIGYNRRIIYTAAAKELQKQILAAQEAQTEWHNNRQKRREAAEKADYSDAGGGGKPKGDKGDGGKPKGGGSQPIPMYGGGAMMGNPPSFASFLASLSSGARKKRMRESTWDRINKYR